MQYIITLDTNKKHIHHLDVANWFIGEYPIEAQGMGGREVRTGKEYGNIFDYNFIELTYPGGAKVMIHATKRSLNYHNSN